MTILVAEDEKDIRNLLQINLEDCGYTVVAVENGKAAWDVLRQQTIQLAILDVMMPGLDGLSLLRKIREISTVPVIFLTARSSDVDKVLALGLGADDYMTKPFSIAELLARVEAHLRRNSKYLPQNEQARKLLEYSDLAIDKGSCSVYKAGELIELGAKEYKLLLFFMEHPEKVFTKRQLYRAVWEDEYYNDENTVMVHISRIRSRIEADSQNPRYLKTIRGIGYKLHATGAVL